jgi:hypothetical protein
MIITKHNLNHVAEAVAFSLQQFGASIFQESSQFKAIDSLLNEMIAQIEKAGYNSLDILNPSLDKFGCKVKPEPNKIYDFLKSSADEDFSIEFTSHEHTITMCLRTYADSCI